MTTIRDYFNNILHTEGYDAWEDANNELIDLLEADWADEGERVEAWATAHNIDLEAGEVRHGLFVSYFQMWVWDNFD